MHRTYFALILILSCVLLAEASWAQATDASNPKQPIATVGGQAVYEDELLPAVQGQLFPLRNQEYEIKKRALDNLIERKLLEAAAKKKGIETEKLLAQDVDSKIGEPEMLRSRPTVWRKRTD